MFKYLRKLKIEFSQKRLKRFFCFWVQHDRETFLKYEEKNREVQALLGYSKSRLLNIVFEATEYPYIRFYCLSNRERKFENNFIEA